MATLSPTQIASAASGAGFPASEIGIAVAVAYAESGGNPGAVNHNRDGSADYGLYQINTVHGALLNQGSWANPNDNARMAHKVWVDAGNSWRPWVAFTSGAYKTPKVQAQTVGWTIIPNPNPALPPLPIPAPGDGFQAPPLQNPLDSITAPLTAVTDFLRKLTNPDFWRRVGWVALGTGLIIAGILTIFHTPIEHAADTATKTVATAVAV